MVYKKVSACMGTSYVFRKAMKAIRQLLHADRATLWMVDEENQQLKTQVAEKTGIIKVPFGSGIVGQVVDTAKGIDIADAYKDERFNQDVDIAMQVIELYLCFVYLRPIQKGKLMVFTMYK